MSATPDSTLANPEELIADLRRQLAECKAERDECEAQKAAIAEVLQVIPISVRFVIPKARTRPRAEEFEPPSHWNRDPIPTPERR